MKKNVTTITVTKDIIHYEAYDGTIFDSEDECKQYEKTSQCAINGAFNQIPQTDVSGEGFYDAIGSFSYNDIIHYSITNTLIRFPDRKQKHILSPNSSR